jgi:uncharacterized protein involved in type VI secretion and phage assembly
MVETRAPRFKIDGANADAALLGRLVDVRVDRRLNLTGSATIRCSGTQEGLPLKMASEVEISSPAGDLAFAGSVTAVEVERYDAQHRVTTFGLLDHSWKLRHTSKAMTRLKTSTSSVASEIISAAGLSASVDPTQTQYEYLLQNGNDLDYLDGLLARENLDWWCEGKTFHAKQLNATNQMTRRVKAVELERLSVRASAVRPDRVVVRGWSLTHDAVSGQKDLQAQDIGAQGTMADLARTGGVSLGQQVHSTASLPVVDAAEASRLAEAALVRAASTAVRAELEGPGLWAVNPGEVVELLDADDATGAYLVTEVQHRFAGGVASSRIISGDRRPPAVAGGGSAADDPSSAVLHGIVVAEVTDLNDPDTKGRVRARFPGLDEQQESDWARVSSISAGSGRGSSIRPEVGDEVLMAFEGGDLRKPVVLGSLFTSKTALPDLKLGGSKFERTTVLHQFGHQIVMWGTGSDGGLEIKLQNGSSLWMDDKKIHLKGGGSQSDTTIEQGQSKIVMKNSGEITISGTKIVLDAQGDVELTAAGDLKATGLNVKANGNVGIELKGGATAKLESSGATAVKGSIVQIN